MRHSRLPEFCIESGKSTVTVLREANPPNTGFVRQAGRAVLPLLLALLLPLFPAKATTEFLSLQFNNQTGLSANDVYITFQLGAAFDSYNVKYTDPSGSLHNMALKAESTNMTLSYSLAEITHGGVTGFQVTHGDSLSIYVSYGEPLTGTHAPTIAGGSPLPAGDDYFKKWQQFELTRLGNPGDQGNITNINYFTAPMKIESKDGVGNSLQVRGFNETNANKIGSDLGALTGNAAAVTKKNGNEIVRYVGPSTFANDLATPYASFHDYLAAIHSTDPQQITKINNHNAFLSSGSEPTNYDFTFNLNTTVNASGDIVMTGNVTTEVTPFGGETTPGPTYSDLTVTVPGDVHQDQAIYGQDPSSTTTFTGASWATLETYMSEHTHNAKPNENFQTLQKTIIGEITTGLLLGYVNSDSAQTVDGIPVKDAESHTWWGTNTSTTLPVQPFEAAQLHHAYYSSWASVLFHASDNQTYSLPYSDRLGAGPLINSVQYEGTDVATWVVTLYAPVTNVIPEPSTWALLGIGMVVAAGLVFRRPSKLGNLEE